MSKKNKGTSFVTYFTHYRSGKKMYARDYGYKAWPFGRGK
jgi:hypothetical protein